MNHYGEEELAAFVDEGLSEAGRGTIKEHLKDCAKCQKLLAEIKTQYFTEPPVTKLLKNHLQKSLKTAARTPQCLDENLLCAYVDGQLSEEERISIAAHIAECLYCAHQAAELYKLVSEEDKLPSLGETLKATAISATELGASYGASAVNQAKKITGRAGKAFKHIKDEFAGVDCAKCGKNNPHDAAYCNACGEQIIPAGLSEIRCPKCVMLLEHGTKICSHCGEVIIRPQKELTEYYKLAKEWLPAALKGNKWLALAIATLLASLSFPFVFIQFCVDAGVFGGIWLFDRARRDKFRQLHRAWEKKDQKEMDRLIAELKSKK